MAERKWIQECRHSQDDWCEEMQGQWWAHVSSGRAHFICCSFRGEAGLAADGGREGCGAEESGFEAL